MMDARHDLGRLGETAAARFLSGHGAVVIDRNLRVDGGEVDLVVRFGATRVAVEVRTAMGDLRPDDAFHSGKRRQVFGLARRIGVSRVDLVGIGVLPGQVQIRWLRDLPCD